MDVLRLLGNPNKEFYKDEGLFLNYLELGIDMMIGKDYTLKKIILHTNFPTHPFFGFHNKCFYELKVDYDGALLKEERKDGEGLFKYGSSNALTQKQQKRKNKRKQAS